MSQPQRPENEGTGPLTSSVEKLREELDRWLDTVMTQGEKTLDRFGLRPGEKAWWPMIDVVETREAVEVYADVPGIEPDSIDVTLAGNMLTLEGEKPCLEAGAEAVVHQRQRGAGKFSRSVPMPVPVNPESVTASSQNGTLCVRLSKAEEAKPRHIRVSGPAGEKGGGKPASPGT